jgi:hypothetical protein
MQELVDVHFPHADAIRLVMDNLNAHDLLSLYETFEPAEARRIARKLEIHDIPKHGSWLNMVGIELSVLARQCLNRRIPDPTTLERNVTAWEQERNQLPATVQWQFIYHLNVDQGRPESSSTAHWTLQVLRPSESKSHIENHLDAESVHLSIYLLVSREYAEWRNQKIDHPIKANPVKTGCAKLWV